MATELRLASRRSLLAMAQAELVAQLLRQAHSHVEVTIIGIDTSGDLDRVSPVATLTEMGAFVRSVQAAIIDGRADAAVHSLKDLPTTSPEGFVLAAFPNREDPRDVLVGSSWDDLKTGATVGTGSPRRIAQLRAARPDIRTSELRGNVDTRVDKVRRGEVDAAVLAAAGLARLHRTSDIAQYLPVDLMVPAPGQGVIAIEALETSPKLELLQAIDDVTLRPLVETERELLAQTGAGCRSALGALATWEDGMIRAVAFAHDEEGSRRSSVVGTDPKEAVGRLRMDLGL